MQIRCERIQTPSASAGRLLILLLLGLSHAEGHMEAAMVRRQAEAHLQPNNQLNEHGEGLILVTNRDDADRSKASFVSQLSDPTLRIIMSVCILGIAVSVAMGFAERFRETSKSENLGQERKKDHDFTAKSIGRSMGKIIFAWLTDKGSRGTAATVVVGLILFWTWREAMFAFFSSAYHAGVANEISAMHQHKDIHKVYSALLTAFMYDLLVGLPTIGIFSPLIDYYSRIRLRDYLTRRALHAYLRGGGQAYYHVKLGEASSGIDNPDQRISEDAQNLADLVIAIFASVLSAVLGFSFWTTVIFGIGGMQVMNICVVFAALRTAIAWIGFRRSLVEARQSVLRQGAHLRYGLMRIRDSAEEIALGNGDKQEYARTNGLYGRLIDAIWSNLHVHIRYNIAQRCSEHIPGLLLWLSLLPLLSSGRIQFGDAMRVHMAYDQASKVFAFMVDNFGHLTELQANAERYLSLVEACDSINGTSTDERLKSKFWDNSAFIHPGKLEKLGKELLKEQKMSEKARESEISIQHPTTSAALVFENVVLTIPNDVEKRSMGGISLTCPANEGLLIMGPSGVGKTSLLRAAAGLWTTGAGIVRRPGGANKEFLQFLPNRCYLPISTLRQLVIYPDQEAEVNCEPAEATVAVQQSLARAKLGHLLERWGLDERQDWRAFLSAGEQQRIAFARLFWHLQGAPSNSLLAILDEATGALDSATEAFLYEELRKEAQPGCGGLLGFISVGHRPDLKCVHDSWLIIGHELLQDLDSSAGSITEGNWKIADGAAIPWKQFRPQMSQEPIEQIEKPKTEIEDSESKEVVKESKQSSTMQETEESETTIALQETQDSYMPEKKTQESTSMQETEPSG
mmetsp:Transcript_5581/g.9962  ORF Transcript_5581/g.9962 Transcript_5581/m.9962 type:complete len:856 (+) Transcript_5581:225-2792(+)